MKELIEFTKMHGVGKDYIYVNATKYPLHCASAAAVRRSAPHTGIGADGLVLIGESRMADFSLRVFNADGSEAPMCGNAARCVGKYLHDKKLSDRAAISLETRAGIRQLHLRIAGGAVRFVTVGMGQPVVQNAQLSLLCGTLSFVGAQVGVGNPHFVVFVSDVDAVDLAVASPLIECHPVFCDRTNVEFAHIFNDGETRMRVWERASGPTRACGTGACATAEAAAALGLASHDVRVSMDGGCLDISWNHDGSLWMTGEAVTVFDGTIRV